MTISYNICVFYLLFITAYCSPELTTSSARCGRSPIVLEDRRGEIQSSSRHSWLFHSFDCTWQIQSREGEPVVISFSQFSAHCKKEWVSLTSENTDPVSLCGSKLPSPMVFPGGNVNVTHHFLPHFYPVSTFHLAYTRDSGACPVTDFECLGGHCLPLSWRCNGQVECLGEGLGTDEQGCEDEAGLLERMLQGTTPGPAPAAQLLPESSSDQAEGDGSSQAERESGWVLRGVDEPPQLLPPSRKLSRITPTPVDWPCGGLLQTFYGTFSPPVIRGPSLYCVWTLDPQDSRPLRLDLQQLELGPGDTVTITNRQQGTGEQVKFITSVSNYKSVLVESHTGLLSLIYHTLPGSEGRGFNATYRVGGYCPPWEGRCGGPAGGCYLQEQRCDGHWDCPETGKDEQGCRGCPRDQFACGGAGQRAAVPGHFVGRPVCFPAKERCNYQLYCADGSDERDCTICQPGTFHCDSDKCVFESWRCDGQVDCKDGTDELNCTSMLPRKVITAATVGSLVCGLLLVIAMGCTCKLYSLRTREYSMFAPISRQEAELIQQQAPPSYGQLIAQGIIPPVEDFPTENPNESSSLSLRGILQLLRQDAGSSPRRRRRPRFIRRAVRRMRRWGLIPRPASRPAQTSASAAQQTDAPPTSPETRQSSPTTCSLAVEAVNQPVPQKLGLLTQTEQQPTLPPPPPAPLSLPPAPPVSPSHATPPVAIPPSSPSLASLFHSLGLNLSLFRPSPSSSLTSLPLSASPSFSSSSSDDEVLLIPLSEDVASEDDVPMLT
ncbi:low-density lipoprotein receptor-related protein 10 isoform X1 [Osmerus mordax]|uniref:low-density lipoprotein receptor-related protein 10 isoform X1 n=1 Tax=Osmerus mordax TaxID=8014 RepID=UPI0035104BD3